MTLESLQFYGKLDRKTTSNMNEDQLTQNQESMFAETICYAQ